MSVTRVPVTCFLDSRGVRADGDGAAVVDDVTALSPELQAAAAAVKKAAVAECEGKWSRAISTLERALYVGV